ncbi:MAG: sterol desaturase family protein [Myxococcota bacterium]
MFDWLELWKTIFLGEMRPVLIGLGCIVFLTMIELIWPAEPAHTLRGRARNLGYLLLYKIFGAGGLALWFAFGPRIAVPQSSSEGFLWFGYLGANLIAIDLLYYFYHRAQHAFPALWALHELHHSDSELNATTSFRTFWLETLVQFLLIMLPTILLFGQRGAEHALVVSVVSYGFLIFTHCNFRLSLGPLSQWICGPQVHRVHHSRLPEHRDRNFAQFFPVIDRIFGTYYAPGRSEFPPTGTETLATDANVFFAALWRPFQIWRGLLVKRRKGNV